MDAHSLKVLEYDQILSMLRERTSSRLGDELAQHLLPATDPLIIERNQKETSEAKRIICEEGGLPLGGIHDVRSQVEKASLGALLQPSDLLEIAGTLQSGRRLKSFIAKRADQCPELAKTAENIEEFPKIEEAIHEAISESGEVRDTASPELARIRNRLKATHAKMMDKLHSIIQSPQYRMYIQDPVITQRGERYCIPVKAEYRHQFPGIVHDSSASGATVFIEPASVVELGNDIKELAIREQQEIERILRQLSELVKNSACQIQVTLSALARLDFASAKGRLSCDMDAVEPQLNQHGRIDLIKARHPLLKGDVVPIDVKVGEKFNVLLITGPNTGGKTVTLKTVGLLTLMAQSGLHIPAVEGSEVAVFDQIFADIGDEQSIQQSLSTFSSHMTNIVKVVREVSNNSLVLLDEIGAGTDPAEGAALAKAILSHLLNKGARVVATTHYGELKAFAFIREGIENAMVEFDVETLRPTYKLKIGIPGSSNALAIASRLGMPSEIIETARSMMQKSEMSAEEVIRKIEETHKVAAEQQQLAEKASKDAEMLKHQYEQRLEELNKLKREIRQQLAEDLERILTELRKQPELPQRVIEESRQRFKERVKQVRNDLEELASDTVEEPLEHFYPKAGDRVLVSSLGVDGELLNDPSDDEAVVLIGAKKVSVPWNTLRPAFQRLEDKQKSGSAVEITSRKVATVSPELKLIAQRVEQALENLDKYMDDAYLAGMDSVRIIHGKGTGALKKAVWEYLANHHAVESFRLGEPSEGGAGATIVKFKQR
jgi:DNA mismatch repair protein MutS2